MPWNNSIALSGNATHAGGCSSTSADKALAENALVAQNAGLAVLLAVQETAEIVGTRLLRDHLHNAFQKLPKFRISNVTLSELSKLRTLFSGATGDQVEPTLRHFQQIWFWFCFRRM